MAFAAPSVVFRAEAPDLRGFPAPTAVPGRKRLDPPALLTFASPSERSSERWSRSSSSRGIRRSPLHRHDRCASTPGRRIPHRHDAARRRTRSARVVSHHLDGFLRTSARGSVAPRSRSWGSSRFGPEPFLATAEPFEGFPSSTAVPRHRGRVPPCRYRRDVETRGRSPGRSGAEARESSGRSSGLPKQTPTSTRTRRVRAPCATAEVEARTGVRAATTTNEPPGRARQSLLRITGGHGHQNNRAARCAVANAGEPAGGRASSSKHLAKRPTSRPCSADESVASHRRCQRGDTRSFHGFWPLQGPRLSAPERRCRAERGSLTRFADRDRSLGGARRVCPVAGSNRRWPREAGRWIRPSWGF